jgi:hypothetical protein
MFMRWAGASWNAEKYKENLERGAESAGRGMGAVRVQSAGEILRALDSKAHNRGLEFKAEMFQFCGGTHRVLKRVGSRVDERNCQLHLFRNGCVGRIAARHGCRGGRAAVIMAYVASRYARQAVLAVVAHAAGAIRHTMRIKL